MKYYKGGSAALQDKYSLMIFVNFILRYFLHILRYMKLIDASQLLRLLTTSNAEETFSPYLITEACKSTNPRFLYGIIGVK